MSAPKNQAAWLVNAGEPLLVSDAPLPTPGPGEMVVKNGAVAINPIDCHMQDIGIFVQQWPTILGADIAGEVYAVGPDVQNFKKGDRVIGHTINMITGRPEDGAYAQYVVVPVNQAAILPDEISYTNGVVVPFALVTAVHALSNKVPSAAMPGVLTPALGLPFPSLEPSPIGKTLVVYGGSSSVGAMTIQLAKAAGIYVIAIAGAHNADLCRRCGADEVFDHKDPAVVERVLAAIAKSGNELAGIVDPISSAGSYAHDIAILAKQGGGQIAGSHPPPVEVPAAVKAGMFYAVSDIAAPVWKDYVTPALKAGKLQCLPPPTVVGKGLEFVQEGLKKSNAGVSGTKVVIEL
ncbi:chaperonin 10-like protein [Leptodontidium sp. MPI-SDFR-AT-0119]|nr:chaperonin 10-like protein [Leptodontidium sp. MPI-SDFR-AT-0119]